MPRLVSADRTSNASDVEEGLQESEYDRLSKQYRIMEADREAYINESQTLLSRQQSEITTLQSERENILKELRLAESSHNRVTDAKNTHKLKCISEETDVLLNEIDLENGKIVELDAKINEVQRHSKQKLRSIGGVNASTKMILLSNRKVRALETTLDKAINRYNNLLATNRIYRESIEDLRFERSKYERIRGRLESELQRLRREITETIEASSQAYETRDEAQAKMILLKDKSDKDRQQHLSEMKELCRVLDHDRNLREFMGIKSIDRPEDEQMQRWRQRKEEREREKKKEAQVDTVEGYEAAWKAICDMTNETYIDALVNKYIAEEDKNFALFNYVNELNSQIESLMEQKANLQREINEFSMGVSDLESDRKHIIMGLETKTKESTEAGDLAETNNRQLTKVIDQAKAGVDSLFSKIGCDRRSIEDLLGSSSGISNENMLQYMGIIEQKVNELIASEAFVKYKDEDENSDVLKDLIQQMITIPPKEEDMPLPVLSEEHELTLAGSSGEEEDADDVKPMSRNELHTKVGHSVKRKERDERAHSKHEGGKGSTPKHADGVLVA